MTFLSWNIVRKDFRLTRIYLVLWWGILAAGALLTIWNLHRILQDPIQFYEDASRGFILGFDGFFAKELNYASNWLFMVLDVILLAVITETIFKSDSPIDERAEWRTRPVSGLGVWRAKLLYLGLFCFLVPGAIQILEYIYLGSDWADCLRGLAQFVVLQSFWVAIVAGAAVLFKRTFSGLLVFCGVAVAVFLAWQNNFIPGAIPNRIIMSFPEDQLHALVALAGLGVVGLVATGLMYSGRSKIVGRVALGSGILAIAIACSLWLKHPHGATKSEPQRDDRVKMAFDPHPVSWVGSVEGHPNLLRIGLGQKITFSDAPGTLLQVTEIHSQLSWPVLKRPPFDITSTGSPLFAVPGAVAAAGYGRLLVGADYDESYYHSVAGNGLQLSKEQLAQIASQPAHWQGTLTGAIGRMVVDWDVPLVDKAQWAFNQSIYKVQSEGSLLDSRGDVGFHLWMASTSKSPWTVMPPINNSLIFILYNPSKKTSLLGGVGPGRDAENLSVYSLIDNWVSFDLTGIFETKYPIHPDNEILSAYIKAKDITAARAYLQTQQKDRTVFLTQHHKEMTDWLAGARLVELRFVPEKQIYNTETIDLPQIITPDVAQEAGATTP